MTSATKAIKDAHDEIPSSAEKTIKDTHDEVQHELRVRKTKLWKEIKKTHFLLQSRANETKASSHPRLPVCVDCSTGTIHRARSNSIKSTSAVQVKTALIEASHPPLPKSRTAILQNYSYMVDDDPEIKFTPNLDDDDEVTQEEVIAELVELGATVPYSHNFGQPHKEKQFLIDATLYRNRLDEKKALPQQPDKREEYYAYIAKLTKVDKSSVRERHQHHIHILQCETNKSKNNSDTPKAVSYDNIIDTYRDLFCRRCFTYDCNVHGNLPKANLNLLGELAVQKEQEKKWAEIDGNNLPTKTISSNQEPKLNCESDDLSQVQQSICERLYLVFQGDIEKMALVMGASTQAVHSFVTLNKIELHDPQYITPKLLKRKRDKVQSYVSMRNYKPEYLNNIQSTLIHPAFIPCDHDEPCNQSNCSCIKNAFFCTKHCGWGNMSTNFFRGCACKAGQCRLSNCACYAANRECDPDLCKCGACTDSPNAPAGDGQRCRNDSISMKRGARLLVGSSSVEGAGLGLFSLHELKKGDFIHEYVGEIISQEEAERRGVVYDRQNMSYLFNLCSDFSIDATVRGNKTRYANHSDVPNIEPRLIRVNGDSRIGFFAVKDMAKQEELFFDYGYSTEIDNEQLFKPNHAHKFQWMGSNKKST